MTTTNQFDGWAKTVAKTILRDVAREYGSGLKLLSDDAVGAIYERKILGIIMSQHDDGRAISWGYVQEHVQALRARLGLFGDAS